MTSNNSKHIEVFREWTAKLILESGGPQQVRQKKWVSIPIRFANGFVITAERTGGQPCGRKGVLSGTGYENQTVVKWERGLVCRLC